MILVFCSENRSNLTNYYLGGQTTIVIDVHHRYPRAYIHRHSLQTPATRPPGFRQEGPSEVDNLCEEIKHMVEGVEKSSVSIMNYIDGKEYTVPKKKIYKQRPHIVADNHFSGENVMEYIGQQGFGITTTCRRDRFPPGLKDYVHHDKVPSTDKRTRVARFEQPILAVKKMEVDGTNKAYC